MKILRLSLNAKFILIAVSLGATFLGVTAYLSNRFISSQFEEHVQEKALLVAKHILQDLEEGMVRRVHQKLEDVLAEYRGKETVDLRLFNAAGKEVFSGNPGPELRVEQALKSGSLLRFDENRAGRPVTTFLLPISKKPVCQRCHPGEQKHMGALLISLSGDQMAEGLARQNRRHFLLFLFITAAVVGTTALAVNRFLIRPIRRLREGTGAVERGDLGYRILETSEDELGILTKSFNSMARRLQALFSEVEKKNRELLAQQDLLLRAESEWRQTFESIADPLCFLDEEGRVGKANRAFRRFFSLAEEGPVGPRLTDLLPRAAAGAFPLPGGVEKRESATLEYHDPDTGKILEISFFPYFHPKEGLPGSVVVLKDITEEKKREMHLIMNERLASLGQMASGISHEILNPLATIGVCAEGLLNRLEKGQIDPGLFTSYLKIIEEEILRCKEITRSMLSFVRPQGRGKTEIDLIPVLEKTLEMISFLGRMKDVTVLRNYEEGPLSTPGEENNFRQAFLAIMVNALDAMDDRGTLTVEAGRLDHSIRIRIGDTGPGIPPQVAPRIFDPFFTTKSEKGGTGLGLSIASQIIREYGGRIEVAPKGEGGAAFLIILPA